MFKKYFVVLFIIGVFFVSQVIVGCKRKPKEQEPQVKETVQPSTTTAEILPEQKKSEIETEKTENIPESKVKSVTESQTPVQPVPEKPKIVLPPKVKYVSYTVEDANKNGKIDTGEKIKLIVTILNIGQGEGKELTVKVDTNGVLMADEDKVSIWPVMPNKLKQFTLGFFVPTATPEKVTVHLTFSEGTKTDILLDVVQKPKTETEKKIEKEQKRIKKKADKAFDELEDK